MSGDAIATLVGTGDRSGLMMVLQAQVETYSSVGVFNYE
jgi:hypothetical protein